ncbi:hypothetical protein SYNPS1DRAFT_24661 [Syncephalis pseudoplumigaleata]|uniref:Uncharacterized protein n=1 Tax=Syncephalis pseudoplumigaleata TaxID=1712513 RepID=A0A4P9YVP6_9FUNG|nr:hypothetical protein SYNPS1DRAFT_24661 [Syncephalis pseudoplumigaleata]|eukprot:RKP23311.1 hypothetical protein SYNPS1DRAFT_24661 [Syncephalis pseudoplumigaleata]
MIRKTDRTACHLKPSLSHDKTEAIRCPKCQLYAHVDCIWALGQAYPGQYTCPLCEISLTEKQISALHDGSRSAKKRIKEYESHLAQLRRVINNYCLSATHASSWLATIHGNHDDEDGGTTSDANTSYSDCISEDEAAIFYEGDEDDSDDDEDEEENGGGMYRLHYAHTGGLASMEADGVRPINDAHTLSPLALHLSRDLPAASHCPPSSDDVPFGADVDVSGNPYKVPSGLWSILADTPSETEQLLQQWLDSEKHALTGLAPLAMAR